MQPTPVEIQGQRDLLKSDKELRAMVLGVLLVCSGSNRLGPLGEALERFGIGRNGVGNKLENYQ
jgi:hypothetical protein